MKTIRKVEILDELSHIFHIEVKDTSMLEKVEKGLKYPETFLSLGRHEDLLIIDSVQIVDVVKKKINSYKMNYNAYVPVESLKRKENIGTIFHINKKYYIDPATNLRRWSDVADVVMYTRGDILDGDYYVDSENDVVFLR